jgi:hypothetical protein
LETGWKPARKMKSCPALALGQQTACYQGEDKSKKGVADDEKPFIVNNFGQRRRFAKACLR